METKDIARSAWDFFGSLSYNRYESFPLLTKDRTLLLVNASIVPFKSVLLNGDEMTNTFIIQQCFRNHYQEDSLFAFSMLGMLGAFENMHSIQDDLLKFLVEVMGIGRERLHVVVDPDCVELLRYCTSRFPGNRIHYTKGNSEKYNTTWRFGEGRLLTGLGLTLVVESSTLVKCRPGCNVFCSCNYYFPLGNFIMVTSHQHGKRYIETGFGLEGMVAAMNNNDYYQVNPYPALIAAFEIYTFTETETRFLARHYAAGAVLCAANIRVANRHAGYVLKRITRSMFEMILCKYQDIASLISLVSQFSTPEILRNEKGYLVFSQVLKDEVIKYTDTIESGKKKIKKMLGSSPGLKDADDLIHELKSTFGLPEFMIKNHVYDK